MAKRILGFGNPICDISATVEQSVLDEWGVTLNNAILAEDKHKPLYAKLVSTHPVEYIAGGATLNSIRTAQWMLGAAAKGSTSFVGSIGKDEFGSTMKSQLGKDGVNGLFLEVDSAPTGTCAVLVKDAERSLIANLAAAEKYDAAHFATAAVTEAVTAASIFYMAGFPLTHDGGKATVTAVCEHALKSDATDAPKTVCMNVSAPFIAEFFKEPLLAAFEYCDFIFCNESEAAALAKAAGWAEETGEDVAKIAEKLAALPSKRKAKRTAVVTQGSDSTIVAVAGGECTAYPVKGNPWELSKEQLVDTNGAGDAFVGGFISQLATAQPMATCVKAGHFAAGTIIQRAGCSLPDSAPDFKP